MEGLIDVPDGTITTPLGFSAGVTAAGIREDRPDRYDLSLLMSETRCAAGAVYTTHRFPGASLRLSRGHLADNHAQALVVNTGVANAFTGEQGIRDAEEVARLVARKLGVAVEDVVFASTGVTGWLLPMDRIRAGIGAIQLSREAGGDLAHAIMTTDTVAKQAAVRFDYAGVTYSVGGAAKGSGMINPNMATMLAFLTTDMAVDPAVMPALVRSTADVSFNQLTIDNETSPDDMMLLLANGAAGGEAIGEGHAALPLLAAAVERVATTLTRKLARDGEGATKLIEVHVTGAATLIDARRAAKAVAGSMLLKAAIFGNDPNWGRALDPIGYSGIEAEEGRITLSTQGVETYRGAPVAYDEAALRAALESEEVRIEIDLGAGGESAVAWGCDLTPEYVRINAEYTT
ncbi:MAG: bifunctional glutamate N-acetyltransferase/amino-acid acetyltransferase ArgJ [Dehalococcoidia bacterium]